jgi:hypothetical protein
MRSDTLKEIVSVADDNGQSKLNNQFGWLAAGQGADRRVLNQAGHTWTLFGAASPTVPRGAVDLVRPGGRHSNPDFAANSLKMLASPSERTRFSCLHGGTSESTATRPLPPASPLD